MFEDSLVESTHRIQTQNRWTFAASIGVQAAVGSLIVILPLLHPETLQRLALMPPTLIAPPAPQPPPPRVVVRTAHASTEASPSAPPLLVHATEHSDADRFMRPQTNAMDVPPGVTITSTMTSGIDPLASPALRTSATPSVTVASKQPLHISSGVSAGMLIAPIHPLYPPIAKFGHIEGTVVIHAIISKSGSIESATVLSGPMVLQGAAIEAVRNARYRPFTLNGEPTEVDTTININFRLSS